MIKSSGQPDALTFPPRQANASLSHGSLKAVPQFYFDKVQNLSHATDFLQACIVDLVVRHPERDIASDCIVDKEKFLRDIADRSLPRRDQFGSKRPAVNEHPSAGRPVQSKQEVDQS